MGKSDSKPGFPAACLAASVSDYSSTVCCVGDALHADATDHVQYAAAQVLAVEQYSNLRTEVLLNISRVWGCDSTHSFPAAALAPGHALPDSGENLRLYKLSGGAERFDVVHVGSMLDREYVCGMSKRRGTELL